MKLAAQKRLDNTRKANAGSNAMDVGNVQDGAEQAWQWGDQSWGGQEGTGGSGTWEEGSGDGGLDWVRKGKMGGQGRTERMMEWQRKKGQAIRAAKEDTRRGSGPHRERRAKEQHSNEFV